MENCIEGNQSWQITHPVYQHSKWLHKQCTIVRKDHAATAALSITYMSNEISKAFCRLGVSLEDLLATLCLLEEAHFF